MQNATALHCSILLQYPQGMKKYSEKTVAITVRVPESVLHKLEDLANAGLIPVSKTHVLQTLIVEEYQRRQEAKRKGREEG